MQNHILSITGRPGLYKLLKQGRGMLIVESVDNEHRRMPVGERDKVVSLNDISIYTDEDDKPLMEVFEAIKAKEKLAEEAGKIGSSELEQLLDSKPEKEPDLIAQDVIDSWNIKERNHYLSLQTKCAVIGKFIHPDGVLSEARKAYMERLSTPKAVKENGKDTLVYTYYPNVEGEEVESLFFALQAEHRSAQAELNGMMHEIEKTITADKDE